MTTKANNRVNLSLTNEVRNVFTAIQEKGKYSHNAMISKFIDVYLKYDIERKQEVLRYCQAVLDTDSYLSVEQYLNDLSLSEVPPIFERLNEIRSLRERISALESQMAELCDKVSSGNELGSLDLSSYLSNVLEENKPTLVSIHDNDGDGDGDDDNPTLVSINTPTIIYTDVLPSTIKMYADRSLDDKISFELGFESSYAYFMEHKDSIKNKEKVAKVTEAIATFRSELRTLLATHCESEAMINALLPIGNKFPINDYLSGRRRNELDDSTKYKVSSLSMRQLNDLILDLKQYTVVHSFMPNMSNNKSPQMTLRMTMSNAYTIITKSEFKTF